MKELRIQNCDVCCNWLQTNKSVKVNLPCELIFELDRGKLTLPTVCSTIAVAVGWFTLQKLIDIYLNSFISAQHQLSILQKISNIQLTDYYSLMNDDVTQQCMCQKTLQVMLEKVNERSCKILLNNLVKQHTDCYVSQKSTCKKLKKLSGK